MYLGEDFQRIRLAPRADEGQNAIRRIVRTRLQKVGERILDMPVVRVVRQHRYVAAEGARVGADDVERVMHQLLVRFVEQSQKFGEYPARFQFLAENIRHGNILQKILFERFHERGIAHLRKVLPRRFADLAQIGIAEFAVRLGDVVFPLLFGAFARMLFDIFCQFTVEFIVEINEFLRCSPRFFPLCPLRLPRTRLPLPPPPVRKRR